MGGATGQGQAVVSRFEVMPKQCSDRSLSDGLCLYRPTISIISGVGILRIDRSGRRPGAGASNISTIFEFTNKPKGQRRITRLVRRNASNGTLRSISGMILTSNSRSLSVAYIDTLFRLTKQLAGAFYEYGGDNPMHVPAAIIGAESVEIMMWLGMRGALTPKVNKVHRNYYMPMLTEMGLTVLEDTQTSAAG